MKTFDLNHVMKAAEVKNKLNAWLKSQDGHIPDAFEVADDFVVKQDNLTLELYFVNRGCRYLAATFRFKDFYVFIRCERPNGAPCPDTFETPVQIENFFNDGLAKTAAEWMKEFEPATPIDPCDDAIAYC